MTDGDECFHALVTYTKEGHKKKGKKWLDGRIQVKKSNRNAVLRDENGTTVVATGRVPCEVELSDDSDEFQLLECSVSYTLLIVITECVSLLANIEAGCSKVVGLKSAKQGNDARACDTDKENENNDEDYFMPASQPACAPPPPKRQRHAFCLPTTALPAPNHRIFRTDAQILSILKSIQELKPTTTEYKPVRPTIERIPAVQPSDDLQGMSKAMSTSFGSSASYRDSWLSCLEGEIITKLGESLSSFYDAVRRANLPPSPSPHAVQSAMEGSRIPYFGSCRMSTWKPAASSFAKFKRNGMKQKLKQKKRKNNECSESEDEPDDHDLCGNSAKPRSFLILTTGKGRLKSSDFSKGDIWVISTDALLGNNHSSSRSQENVWIVRSLWHGPNIDGKFEVEFLSLKNFQNASPLPYFTSSSTPLVALKGPDAALELSLMDLLQSKDLINSPPPIFPALLNPSKTCPSRQDELQETNANANADANAVRIAEICRLNVEQAQVLHHVAGWASRQRPSSPLCLVFGPFGCGKSSLLVAVIRLVMALRSDRTSLLHGARVLVTAHTNTAVDRILLALADLAEVEGEAGETESEGQRFQFLRVGPLRRIDKRLLPYSLHASSSSSSTTLSEIQDMLKECPVGESHQRTILESELKAYTEGGAERRRRMMLKKAPVVGVTACSSLLPVLDGQVFDIVILDESSQMIEPLSLAPLVRSNARFLVAAGDPKQLPPLVSSKSEGAAQMVRPLFVRLTDAGCCAHMLKRQYRCHPDISAIANANFYDNTLIDGCTAAQRPSLLRGLPSLVFINVHGTESRSGKSIYNGQEAAVTARFLSEKCNTINPAQCGIICFYRAQVDAVQRAIQSEQSRNNSENVENLVTVATVDGFQGAERDVIILTTATTKPGAFASDACRLNVALTRARHNLVVIGHAKTLEASSQGLKSFLSAVRRMPNGYLDGSQAFT